MFSIEEKLEKIEDTLQNGDLSLDQMNVLFKKRRELEFLRNKENILFPLRGDRKYYNADQCYTFAKNFVNSKEMANSFLPRNYVNSKAYHDQEGIDRIMFGKKAITLVFNSTAQTDLHRFNNSQEMFGFVAGWNQCHLNEFDSLV